MAKITFGKICMLIVVRNMYNDGCAVEAIAKAAKRAPSTIRRWLREVGVALT